MEKVKKIILLLIVLALIAGIVLVTVNFVLSKTDVKKNPVITMEIEGYGTVKIELYPDMAPNTVKNFVRLAQRGYYDGKTITDIEDKLIRGGLEVTTAEDGKTTTSGPKYSNLHDLAEGEKDRAYNIPGEFIENGFNDNTLSHQRGVISMYRITAANYQSELAMVKLMGEQYSSYADTLVENMQDSQNGGFFIVTEDAPEFDGQFAAFGRVIEGMDVVDAISKIELQKATTTDENGNDTATDENSTKPVNAPVISKVTAETYGVEYGEPETANYFEFDDIFNMFMQNYMQGNTSLFGE